jgi:hypothetical protein
MYIWVCLKNNIHIYGGTMLAEIKIANLSGATAMEMTLFIFTESL